MKDKVQNFSIPAKIKKIVLTIAGTLLIYSVIGFFILPLLIKNQIPEFANKEFNRIASVKEVSFNPFSIELNISDFTVNNLDDSSFAKFQHLYVNVSIIKSISELTLMIDQFKLEQPNIVIKRHKKGVFNFSDLLSSGDESKPNDEKPFPLTISDIYISEGKISWEDNFYIKAQQENIEPLNLHINNFTTLYQEQSELGFSLVFASGGKFEWKGQFGLTPLQSAGQIKLDDLGFKRIWQLFLQDSVNFKILSGTELIELDYQLSDSEQGLQLLVDKANINFYQMQLSEKDNTEALINIPEFKLSGIKFDLLQKKVAISTISANDAYFKSWLDSNGNTNFQSLFAVENDNKQPQKQAISTPEETPSWKINVAQLDLKNFSFHFIDKSLPTYAHFNLASLNIYATDLLIDTAYNLTETEKDLQLLINNANVELTDFKLTENGETEALVSVPEFKVAGISFDLLKKNIIVSDVSSKDALVKAWLDTDGIVNYQTLFTANTNEDQTVSPAKSDSETNATPWEFSIVKFALSNYDFNFIDKSLPKPAKLNFSAINLDVNNLSSKVESSLPFNLDLKLNKKGQIKLSGDTVVQPFSSNIKAKINSIAIKDFQSYIDEFVLLDVISGLFNLDANISLAQKQDSPLSIKLKGNSHINNFVSRDQVSNKDFLNWKKLNLQNIDIDLAANRFNINNVSLNRPYARVLIREDKTININDIVKNSEPNVSSKKNKPQTPAKKEIDPTFKIAKFTITEGVSDFSDRSLILPFSAHMNELKGAINGISSDKNAVIDVVLNGQVSNLAPVNITGTVSPDQGDSEIRLDFKSMPLPIMTPYMAEFAGRKIEKGNMSLDLQYKIQNKKLSASNNLLIDQLVLGEEVENPDAVALPLELAIALLQDVDGKIALDVPITGSLDDPEFSIAGIVFDALVNVLTKIVTSPFSAISSLMGSDEDISKVIFSAGNALINEKEREKLDGLAKALVTRPALKLEIKGATFTEQDWPNMQLEALQEQLLQMRANDLSKETEKKVLAENLTLSEQENQRYMADLFIQKFPDLAERSLFGTPQLLDPTLGDFYTVAEQKLANIIPPNQQSLQELAVARAQAIAKYLVSKEVAIERIFLLGVDIDPSNEDSSIATQLSLIVK